MAKVYATHWLLEVIEELEGFAEQENLHGLLDGLSNALEEYASDSLLDKAQHLEILCRLGRETQEPNLALK